MNSDQGYYLIAGIILTVCGTGSLIPFVISCWKSRRACRWPQVPGVITKSRVHAQLRDSIGPLRPQAESLPEYTPLIVYTYDVDGKSYRNVRLSHFNTPRVIKEIAKSTSCRYPVDCAVTVYYNPKNPQDAVLEPQRAVYLSLLIALPCLALIVIGIFIATSSLWSTLN